MNPKDFRSAYLDTVYDAGGVRFQYSETNTGLVLYSGKRFTLMTAANPRSQNLSDADNAERNAQMRAAIQASGRGFEASLGMSPDGSWQEHGFLIWDAPLIEVLKLGRTFGQNAIVYGELGRIALAWCDDELMEWFYAKAV
jgi:hypothetical protein